MTTTATTRTTVGQHSFNVKLCWHQYSIWKQRWQVEYLHDCIFSSGAFNSQQNSSSDPHSFCVKMLQSFYDSGLHKRT